MQAYILSINSKWVSAIKDGTKKYEFRSLRYKNLKTGNKIYICETKRTKHIMTNSKKFDYCYNCAYKTWDIGKPIAKYCAPLIVGEFIIKKIWWLHLGVGAWKFDDQGQAIDGRWFYSEKYSDILDEKPAKEMIELTNHPGHSGDNCYFAFEISQLKFYQEPKLLLEFDYQKAPQFYYKIKEAEIN